MCLIMGQTFLFVNLIKCLFSMQFRLVTLLRDDNEQGHKNAGSDDIKHRRVKSIKAPKIYWDYTCPTVLTMEWLDGIKLTDETGLKKASLSRRELIDQV